MLLARLRKKSAGTSAIFSFRADSRRVVGCLSLEKYGAELAEGSVCGCWNRTRGSGIGAKLIAFALEEARQIGIARVLAVTHAPQILPSDKDSSLRRESAQ